MTAPRGSGRGQYAPRIVKFVSVSDAAIVAGLGAPQRVKVRQLET